MMAALAILLSFALVLPPGASEDERLQAAREDYKNDRFAPAAWAFEALAKDFPDNPKYHYFAGLARENAGHDTHAALHLREFLASDAGTPEERAIAEKRLAAIAKRTTRVRVKLPPAEGAKTLHISYVGPKSPRVVPKLTVPLDTLARSGNAYELTLAPGLWDLDLSPRQLGDRRSEVTRVQVQAGESHSFVELDSSAVLHELELTLAPPRAVRRGVKLRLQRQDKPDEARSFTARTETTSHELSPGNYTYEASARGFKPAQGEFIVHHPTFETITLRPKLDPQERRRRLTLGLSLAGAGLVTGVAGAVLLVYGEKRLDDLNQSGSYNKYEISVPLVLGEVGSGFLGATAGLWAGAAVTPLSGPRAMKIGLAVGCLAAVGGGMWYGLKAATFQESIDAGGRIIPSTTVDARLSLFASSALFGAGSGIIAATAAALLSKRTGRVNRRASFQPMMSAKSLALLLTLRM